MIHKSYALCICDGAVICKKYYFLQKFHDGSPSMRQHNAEAWALKSSNS